MKCYLPVITIIILVPFLAWGECDSLFYSHRLKACGGDRLQRLECLDSLLAVKRSGRDSILIDRLNTAYELGLYPVVADSYERLKTTFSCQLSLSEELRLNLSYIHALHATRRYLDCISECIQLQDIDKPDTLRYYDTLIDCVLLGFNKKTSMLHAHEYIERNKALLKEAEKDNWPSASIDRIKHGLYSMYMQEAMYRGDFKQALAYSDCISPFPLTDKQRLSLDTNIAYLYMRLGKHDEAEECFKKLLSNGPPSYNQAVSLLNYTHMLNLQGRYRETLELLERHHDIAKCFDGDLYEADLLGNRAIAESHLGMEAKAYSSILRSRELADSIMYSSDIQDGVLMLGYSEQKIQLKSLDNRLKRSYFLQWILLGIAVGLSALTAWLLIKTRNSRKCNDALKASMKESDRKYADLDKAYSELSQEVNGKLATQLAQVATVEDTLTKVEGAIGNQDLDQNEKLKLIVSALASSEAKRDGRERFEQHFEQAHAKFLKNLYASHSDLTPGEVRMCAYIIMNLSNKEIACLTNKSVRSVESTRYRISKKLNLPEGESISFYLRRFID